MATNDQLPKAVLYSWPSSVWSTVPQLCLFEKGYSSDEYVIRQVDITKGENFNPSYLKINMNGTIPTLVVPMMETTGTEVDSRYRSLRDTITICDFLDQARGSHTHNTVSERPAPALSPATIEGKATCDSVIATVHHPANDPNFIIVSVRNPAELNAKSAGLPGKMLSGRKESLAKYLREAKQLASGGASYETKMVSLLQEKQTSNQGLWDIYNGKAGEEKAKAFYEASRQSWEEAVPRALDTFEASIDGPYVLGDQICLADLHLISWLTRITLLAHGRPDASGMDELERQLGKKKVGPKVRVFWAAWLERPSFKQVLVPSCTACEAA